MTTSLINTCDILLHTITSFLIHGMEAVYTGMGPVETYYVGVWG